MMQSSDRMESCWPDAGSLKKSLKDVQDQAVTAVNDYPMAVVLGAFGAGLAVGAAVGMILAETALAPPPETMTQKTWDAISKVLPEAVMRQLRS